MIKGSEKMKQYGKVAVLFGGSSAEREVSLMSGNAVLAALCGQGVDAHAFDPAERPLNELREQEFTRAFIALHGRGGEDGTIQGALEYLHIPYTGSGVMASAIAMDKWRTKLMWQALGIPTPRFEVLTPESDFAAIEARLGLPLMVKPVHEGSTVGIVKVTAPGTLEAAFHSALEYDSVVIVERFITGPEYTASILHDQALPLICIEVPSGLYDYQAKYFKDDTRYFCPSGLPDTVEHEMQTVALRAFQVLGCQGWGRIDLMRDSASGAYYLLEVNTSPGMTGHSLVPMAAKQAGLSFAELCLAILDRAHVG